MLVEGTHSRRNIAPQRFDSMVKRNYIGIACSAHDSAIAILDSDGNVAFAEATERYLQSKRALNVAADLPLRTGELISQYCDSNAEIVIAFSWSNLAHDRFARNLQRMGPVDDALQRVRGEFAEQLPGLVGRSVFASRYFTACQLQAQKVRGGTLEYELEALHGWGRVKVHRRAYDHHLTHAAAACFSSPFEKAVCAILDGYGEETAFACYTYANRRLEQIPCEPGAGSLGIFYMDVCEACGFSSVAGEEWKVMGLAAYGQFDPEIYSTLREMIAVQNLSLVAPPHARRLELLARLDARARRTGDSLASAADIAHTGQRVFCEVLYEYLRNLHRAGSSNNLILSGGCGLNSAANGGVTEQTPFKNLHVFFAPADDGNALGAAWLAFQEDRPSWRPSPTARSPYLGTEMCGETVERLLKFAGSMKLRAHASDAPRKAAELLADHKIIGWIQGRAEFGPRALGNRSILADPRRPQVRDEINSRVKFREEYRPLAPAILHEFGPRYFEEYQESPYMERALLFRKEVVDSIPGAVHIDGTGRVQSVKKEWNPRFHELLVAFYEITGIPVVVNTSYNVMSKPIVHTVEDVLAVFLTTGLDAVFIGDLLLEKP